MTEHAASSTLELDHPRAFAFLSLLAAVTTTLLLVATLKVPPPRSAAEQLALLASHRGTYVLLAVLDLSWAVFSIPFVVALGRILRAKSASFAVSATILSAAGILMLGFATFTYLGALLSIMTAGSPPRAADAVYQAAIWGSLAYYLTDPGLMTWGLGQFLFGWLGWRSRVLPNWVAAVGMVGGIAGLLTLGVYQSSMLAVVQIACFAVWGFATGVVLLRR